MKCEKCNKEIDGTFGSGRFCNRRCANSRIRTNEIKEKISKSLMGNTNTLGKIHKKESIDKIKTSHRKRSKTKNFRIKDLKKEKTKCQKCYNIKYLEVHHNDDNNKNNNWNNIIVLCKRCHKKEHYIIGTKTGKSGRKNVKILN